MKNLIKISITVVVLLVILCTSALAITGTVNAPSGLVLREKADKNANPLSTVLDKTEVKIIEKAGEWYKVEYNSQEGYLFAEYVNVEENIDTESQETQEQENIENEDNRENYIQSNNKLKVYNIPLITSTVINEIEPNSEITVIKQITNWSYVSAGEIQGWVRTYGIQNQEQTETPEEPDERLEVEEEQPNEEVVGQEEPNTSESEKTTVEEEKDKTTSNVPTNSAQTETNTTKKGIIAVESARVREKPTTESKEVTSLIKGTSFTIIAETEEWYKIKYIGIEEIVYEGYIYKPLVTIE